MNNKGFSPIHLILVLLIPAALITVFYVYFGNPFEKNETSYSESPQEAYVLAVEETLYFDDEYSHYINNELKVTFKFPTIVKYESGTDCGVITSPVMVSYQSGTSSIFINSTRVNVGTGGKCVMKDITPQEARAMGRGMLLKVYQFSNKSELENLLNSDFGPGCKLDNIVYKNGNKVPVVSNSKVSDCFFQNSQYVKINKEENRVIWWTVVPQGAYFMNSELNKVYDFGIIDSVDFFN